MIKEKDQELKRGSTAPLWQEYYIYLNEKHHSILEFLPFSRPQLSFHSSHLPMVLQCLCPLILSSYFPEQYSQPTSPTSGLEEYRLQVITGKRGWRIGLRKLGSLSIIPILNLVTSPALPTN